MLKDKQRARRIRRNLLWGAAGIFSFMLIVFLIPGILVNRFEAWKPSDLIPLQPQEALEAQAEPLMVPVYLTQERQTVHIPLEEYVRGVVAAEMPASFELEALKAQAIAARTYLVRRMESGDASNMPAEAGGALVTDTVLHQAYVTEKKLRERWGLFAYARNMDKLTKAVNETQGLVLTYQGSPIEATFFSSSNGFTEHSEHYWQAAIPYLRSVASPWDEQYAPNYEQTVAHSVRDIYKRLGLPNGKKAPAIKVVEKSPSGRILRVKVAGHSFTGRELREKLELASTDFTWTVSGNQIVFRTAGYGHGVGMSQWGANGMAKEGKTAKDILTYYYSGVQVEPLENVLANKVTAM
jgi:stage II sporulation protein D